MYSIIFMLRDFFNYFMLISSNMRSYIIKIYPRARQKLSWKNSNVALEADNYPHHTLDALPRPSIAKTKLNDNWSCDPLTTAVATTLKY